MKTVGIDLASQPKDTASCVIEWRDDEATVALPAHGVTDDDILSLIQEADAAGVDAPFGWPIAEVEATYRWTMQGTWVHPPATELRFRATDRRVRDLTGRTPLSTTSDWIVWATWRCVAILDRLNDGDPVERIGEQGVFEVYPGATLRRWAVPTAGYKTDPDIRREVLDTVLSRIGTGLHLEDTVRQELHRSDDALDAFIAAVVARIASREDRNTWPPQEMSEDELAIVRREGWIHLPPPDSLDNLLRPARS